jgi:hypothetical protein
MKETWNYQVCFLAEEVSLLTKLDREARPVTHTKNTTREALKQWFLGYCPVSVVALAVVLPL